MLRITYSERLAKKPLVNSPRPPHLKAQRLKPLKAQRKAADDAVWNEPSFLTMRKVGKTTRESRMLAQSMHARTGPISRTDGAFRTKSHAPSSK